MKQSQPKITVEQVRQQAAQMLSFETAKVARYTGLSTEFCAKLVAKRFENRLRQVAGGR